MKKPAALVAAAALALGVALAPASSVSALPDETPASTPRLAYDAALPLLRVDNLQGIPAVALPNCSNIGLGPIEDMAAGGGWSTRSFISNGTPNVSQPSVPVRTRAIGLGEPCADLDGNDSVVVPVYLSELPIDTVPSDNPPPVAGADTGVCAYMPRLTAALAAASKKNCAKFEIHGYLATGTPPLVATGNIITTGYSLTAGGYFSYKLTRLAYPNGSRQGPGSGTIYLACKRTSDGAFQMAFSVNTIGAYDGTTAEQTGYFNCPGGYIPFSAGYLDGYALDKPNSEAGVFWRADGLDEPAGVALVDGTQSSYATVGLVSPYTVAPGVTFACMATRTSTTTSTLTYNPALELSDGLVRDTYHAGLPDQVIDHPGGSYLDEYRWESVNTFRVLPEPASACPFISSITFTVCVWHTISASGKVCTPVVWSYASWKAQTPYPETTPEEDICNTPGGGSLEQCQDVWYPPVINYTDFETVCADPPAAEWLSFAWIPEVIGFYADCLFYPRGGWDAHGDLAAVWEASSLGQLQGVLVSTTESFRWSEGCGVVMDATSTIVPIQIDTCDWAAQANPIHDFLVVLVWILFALWAVPFVANTATGMVTKQTQKVLD